MKARRRASHGEAALDQSYHDAAASVVHRVADLLARMTLDEKLAQLVGVWSRDIVVDGAFSPKKAWTLAGAGMGHLTRHANLLAPRESARLQNEIQRFLRERTRLGIPAVVHEESCAGYCAQGADQFPMPIGLAASFDPDLVARIGGVIGRQMLAVGARHALAPVADVARDHRWGRCEETFGEDVHLVSRMAVAYVQAVQGEDAVDGVICTGKHFAGYAAGEAGLNWAPSHLGERELMDVYVAPFAAMIAEAGLGSVMNAYQEIDGVPCGAGRRLLTDILRGELGFTGTVVSDYFTLPTLHRYHNIAADLPEAARLGIRAGLDVELPAASVYGEPLRKALLLDPGLMADVDLSVARVLAAKFEQGLFENPFVDEDAVDAAFSRPADRALAREAASRSVVLLKNDGGLLPLSLASWRIAVIGPHAHSARLLLGDYHFPAHHDFLYGAIPDDPDGDAGAAAALTGSAAPSSEGAVSDPKAEPAAAVSPAPHPKVDLSPLMPRVVTVLEGVRAAAVHARVVHARGCGVTGEDRSGFAAAVEAARGAEAAIVCVGERSGLAKGATSGEANDRATLRLSGVQQDLLAAVAETGTPVVLVVLSGRPLALTDAVPLARAVLYAWTPGEEGGSGVADVLFGAVNPSAKLPVSLVRDQGQLPCTYAHKPSGGRSQFWGDYADLPASPLFPFGFGLSYARFDYGEGRLAAAALDATGTLAVEIDVAHAGGPAGEEVVQLYVCDKAGSVTRPVAELKAFARLSLAPGETRTVRFEVPVAYAAAFTGFDHTFAVEPGEMEVMVGASSADIRWRADWRIVGDRTRIDRRKLRPGYSTLTEKGRP